MRIRNISCPECQHKHVVDSGLYSIGSVRLRCVSCGKYFLPPGSPADRTVEDVTNASVPITIWEPGE
jgi:transposase-like protein